MTNKASVTVIIPTRNRLESLNRTLRSVAQQTIIPKEIIIIDSSDQPLQTEQLAPEINAGVVQIIYSKPSVCLQRNIGINQCDSEYLLLCDDDVEIPKDYVAELFMQLEKNAELNVVSGLVYEKINGQWQYAQNKKTFLKLLYAHIFGLSVWTELRKDDFSKNRFVRQFVSRYLKKGNRIAKSGWPIVIDYSQPSFITPVYSLMASILRTGKIKDVLFETAFYENGIGDNYDILIGMSSDVTVFPHLKVLHHEEQINRVPDKKAYYYRIAALHFILLKHKRFNFSHLAFFTWSLLGNSILFILKGDWKKVVMNLKLSTRIFSGTSIYGKSNTK